VSVEELLGRLDLNTKVRLITGASFWTTHAVPEIGLRSMAVSDGPAGVRGTVWDEREPSVNLPSPTALAASWDESLVERVGRLLAEECRRKGIDVLLAPTVNLHRTPYGGRHFECFSEDPLLTGRIGSAYVRGVQSGGVGACVKHFVANDSETGRMTADVRVDARTLRELYVAPFEAIVAEAAPWSVMAAYNSVTGHTMTESPLLDDVLKGAWGFDGVVMSDWFATRSVAEAGRAGLDLAMPGQVSPWSEGLAEAVRRGEVPEVAVDEKVRCLLRLAERVGALEGSGSAEGVSTPEISDESRVVAREAAVGGFVLLRNEGELLPLSASALSSVAVIGPNAAVGRPMGGGSASVCPPYTVAPLDGLRDALPGARVTYAEGVRSHERLGLASASQLAVPGTHEQGFLVRAISADGEVLGEESRFAASLLWNDTCAGAPLGRVASIEVDAVFRAHADGLHTLGASGLGRMELLLDGKPTADDVLRLPEGADIVEGFMRPPQLGMPVDLAADDDIRVTVRYQPAEGQPLLAFQLNAEPPRGTAEEELDAAARAAAEADIAIVVVGTTEEVESEGFDRTSLALPGPQDDLVRRVVAANPRTVVVVNAGAPVLMPWADEVPSVLLTWFPGQEFGNALADALLGLAEPGGRLPTAWPAEEANLLPSTQPVDGVLDYAESLHIGQRGFDRAGVRPAFPFGHGLGYSTWEYVSVGEPAVGSDCVMVTARVRNGGPREGREVVQVYASRPDSAVDRPVRWLAGFAAVDAEAGETVEVALRVARRAFEHWDEAAGTWTTEPGTFLLEAGRSSTDLRLSCPVEL
jgi:beta-glucosidase